MERGNEETKESSRGSSWKVGWIGTQRGQAGGQSRKWAQGRLGQKPQEESRGAAQRPAASTRSPEEIIETVITAIRARFGDWAIGLGDHGIGVAEDRYLENRAEPAQLVQFCGCGWRPMELREPGYWRLCYCRRYRSLRFCGSLREAVLKRDRFRCRACGASARLVVHHRNGDNKNPGWLALYRLPYARADACVRGL
jgi:hypothetical protein